MGCAGSTEAEYEGVSVPELAGAWVPTNIDNWVACPAPWDHRVQTYFYVIQADGSWIDTFWNKHKGQLYRVSEGSYAGYGLEPGRFKANWTLGADGVLTVRWGDHGEVVYYLVRAGDPRASTYCEPTSTPNLEGEWYSLERASGHPNGDRCASADCH